MDQQYVRQLLELLSMTNQRLHVTDDMAVSDLFLP